MTPYWSLRRRSHDYGLPDNKIANRRRREVNVEGSEPTLDQVLDVGYLLEVHDRLRREGGQAPGADGIGFDRLGRMEIAAVEREKCAAIRCGRYRPDRIRRKRIPKASGGYRELHLPSIPDRILFAALNDWLSPFWERIFLPRSYGFRPRRSHLGLLAALDAEIRATGKTVVVIDDVRKAFDNVNIAHCMTAHRRHLRSEELLTYITTALRGHDLRRTIGIGQGNAYSPTALNVLLHEAHDRIVDDDGNDQTLSWYRYADNLAYLVRDTTEGQSVRHRITDLLQRAEMTLKEEGSQMVDLRFHPAELLGLTIQIEDTQVIYSISESSWDSLSDVMEDAHESVYPTETARSVIRGWIGAIGPALETLTEPIRNRISMVSNRNGFRGISRQMDLSQIARDAHQRWIYLRDRAYGALRILTSEMIA